MGLGEYGNEKDNDQGGIYVLLLAMAVSAASCGRKTNKKIRKISEDSPWFDAKITEVETGAEKGRVIGSWLNQEFVTSDDLHQFLFSFKQYQFFHKY